ncbi:MAG: hypothetical protein R8G66_28140 [Cytophagales bacterium]|nr:hypothetical protein [Cytophagales bacterium]
MRLPSLIRLPRNKQFHIEPRHYDPIKEELEERTSRIRNELRSGSDDYRPGNISFSKRSAPMPSTNVLQLAIAAILSLLVVGWLYWGNDVAYIFVIGIPIYFFFRFRKFKRR